MKNIDKVTTGSLYKENLKKSELLLTFFLQSPKLEFFCHAVLIDYSPIGIAEILKVSNAYEFSRTAQQNLCRNRDNHFCKKKLYYL